MAIQNISFCLFFIIGLLFGIGISDWKVLIQNSSVVEWLSAIGSFGMLILGILTINAWKKQRKPDATIELLKTIQHFHAKLYNEYSQFLDVIEQLDAKKQRQSYINKYEDYFIQFNDDFAKLEYSLCQYNFYHKGNKLKAKLDFCHQRLLDLHCSFCKFNRKIELYIMMKVKVRTEIIESNTQYPKSFTYRDYYSYYDITRYALDRYIKFSTIYLDKINQAITGSKNLYGNNKLINRNLENKK